MKRRGMTFVEVVVAVALLALLASTVFGAFNFMIGRQRLEQQTLGAYEVANRLVLSFLDDRRSMPDSSLPIEYGPDRYRWDLRETPVKLVYAEPAHPDTTARVPAAPNARVPFEQRVRQVTVRAWLGEESGGTYYADAGVPHANITRLIYPLTNRNPDSFDHMLKSDIGIRGYMDEFLGGERAAPANPNEKRATPGGGGRPAPAGRAPGATPAPSRLPLVPPGKGGS